MAHHYKIYGKAINEKGTEQRVSAQESLRLRLLVGLSRKTSYEALGLDVRAIDRGDNIDYEICVDGELVKHIVLNKKTKTFLR